MVNVKDQITRDRLKNIFSTIETLEKFSNMPPLFDGETYKATYKALTKSLKTQVDSLNS